VNHLPATAWWRPAGIAAATASPASCTCWRASGSQLSGSWGHIKAGQRAQAVVAVDVNLLGDERAAGSQDPADLGRPERLVPASDQPEHAITEGQPPPVVPGLPGVARRAFILDDRDAQRPQPGQALTTAGAHVQQGAGRRGAAGHLATVAPGQRSRRRPRRQSREIPARKRGIQRLGNELVKRGRRRPRDSRNSSYRWVMAGLSRTSRAGFVSSSSAMAARDFTKSEKER